MFALTVIVGTMLLAGPTDNPALETAAKEIEGKLIAPCCWSQPVSQHYSEAADKIRVEIRELLAAGKTEREILDYYASTYGERILASPRARGFNLLVYILPWVALLAGAAIVIAFLRKQRSATPPSRQETEAPSPTINQTYTTRLEEELRDLD
jgi:cytochrome c-type biogenesis protein CcmH